MKPTSRKTQNARCRYAARVAGITAAIIFVVIAAVAWNASGSGRDAAAASASASYSFLPTKPNTAKPPGPAPEGMVWIPGGEFSMGAAADERVRNLAQVKPGDHVNAVYYESLAYEVKKAGTGEPGVTMVEGMERAKPGEKPAGVAVQTMTITATIAAIDKGAMTVTLRDPGGNMTTVKARDPEKLNRVSVGDLVDVTYTEALAIAVEMPK